MIPSKPPTNSPSPYSKPCRITVTSNLPGTALRSAVRSADLDTPQIPLEFFFEACDDEIDALVESSPEPTPTTLVFGGDTRISDLTIASVSNWAIMDFAMAAISLASPGKQATTNRDWRKLSRRASSCFGLCNSVDATNVSTQKGSSSPPPRVPYTAKPPSESAVPMTRPKRVSARGNHARNPVKSTIGFCEASICSLPAPDSNDASCAPSTAPVTGGARDAIA
mmetsp:Transcript_7290/g.27407  ORF Transcript_7290/g.27407 Transcript_7290/m.27407 type:complete len:224 (-) Transcript_7290:59-730(-)